jgi:hypothetical protein
MRGPVDKFLIVILPVVGGQVNRIKKKISKKMRPRGARRARSLFRPRELEGATLPSRVHYRQGRTGGATSGSVVCHAQPSEGGTYEATSAETAGKSVRSRGTRNLALARNGRHAGGPKSGYSLWDNDLRPSPAQTPRGAGIGPLSRSSAARCGQVRP